MNLHIKITSKGISEQFKSFWSEDKKTTKQTRGRRIAIANKIHRNKLK
jgi:hypothetical protein